MKKIFLFFVLLLFFCSKNETTTKLFPGTFDAAKNQAQKENKLLLILLTSDSK